jgi:hypothetical protein
VTLKWRMRASESCPAGGFARAGWNNLLEKFKPFSAAFGSHQTHPSDVSLGSGEARDEPEANGVAAYRDNWDAGRRLLRGAGCFRTVGKDDIEPRLNKLGRRRG